MNPLRIIEVAFEYSDDVHTWDVVAQVETDGEDSYTMIMVDGIDDASDHVYDCVKQKAEDKAWQLDQKPKNRRTGCDCFPKVSPLAQALHDDTCPRRLQGEEREAFNDLLRKETYLNLK